MLVKPFEGAIVLLHDTLKSVGVDEAYGPAIIMFTVLRHRPILHPCPRPLVIASLLHFTLALALAPS